MVIEKNSGLSLQMFHSQFFPKLFNFGSLFVLNCTTARDGMGFASRWPGYSNWALDSYYNLLLLRSEETNLKQLY